MQARPLSPFIATGLALAVTTLLPAGAQTTHVDIAVSTHATASVACGSDDTGIQVPPGFCATVFADNLGHARHIAVSANGTVYVNTWSGNYFRNSPPPDGGFIVVLRDTHGTGHADVIERFGDDAVAGGTGGTGIALYGGALYVEERDSILRYELEAGSGFPSGAPAIVVSGLPTGGDHPMHPFVIDAHGKLYLDSASATNACDVHNRQLHTAGQDPCTELQTRGGIWRFDANRRDQRFSAAQRYATGIRNGEGMGFDSAGRLYVTQHGRDQLAENWPELYRPAQGQELPAEEIVELREGADYGWPQCYYDGFRKRLVLAPEYGGDGGHKTGVCDRKTGPVATFPAHWAPNDLLIYSGRQFPAVYRDGAFIAFHGSWNRAPAVQAGYNIVFQPLAGGHPSGNYIVFADGFAGPVKAPGRAIYRPSGLAQGPDGSLYVSDDLRGRIWRIRYAGDPAARVISGAVPAPHATGATPDGRPDLQSLALAPKATRAQLSRGERLYQGDTGAGTCAGCHASDGRGSSVGPDLTTGKWLWGDGSLTAIAATIRNGVPQPRHTSGAMPARGGVPLSDSDVEDVAVYVWGLGHRP